MAATVLLAHRRLSAAEEAWGLMAVAVVEEAAAAAVGMLQMALAVHWDKEIAVEIPSWNGVTAGAEALVRWAATDQEAIALVVTAAMESNSRSVVCPHTMAAAAAVVTALPGVLEVEVPVVIPAVTALRIPVAAVVVATPEASPAALAARAS
jgi:hypothetical protein